MIEKIYASLYDFDVMYETKFNEILYAERVVCKSI